MAINTHQADHVEYIQDSDGNKHYLNAEYLDGHSYGDIKSSVANHYTPAANSSAQLSAHASSTTVATWNSTSLVTGVNLQRDSKGHVTGVTVDSIKMPANPNTHQAIKTLKTDNTEAQATSASETITGSGTINLHKVSKTGNYNDLNNKPNIPTMSHIHNWNGSYSADNKNDHTVYSKSSTANENKNGCFIMVHGHIMYQSGYINITDTGSVFTDYDSYAVQAGQEGYWGKSWVTATAFFEPGKTMYVHAKGVENIYVVCVFF